MDTATATTGLRLIEAGFPCHQVGAETQREQSVGLQPPVNRLHVWWARRPLTPSRAAIVASLAPVGTDPETFVRQLGIERVQALVRGQPLDPDRQSVGAHRAARWPRAAAGGCVDHQRADPAAPSLRA